MPVFAISDLSVRAGFGLMSRPRTIVSGVSLAVGEREVVAILGRSGVGKTVLWHAMFGLSSPGLSDSFAARLPALSEAAFEAWRRTSVAFVQQGGQRCLDPSLSLDGYLARLFSRSVIAEARERFTEASAALGLTLNARDLGRSVATFSGGESQRIAFALRLASRPKILVLDEPSAALDFDTAQQMKALVASVAEIFGVAVICVTHDYYFISGLARRALYLEGGAAAELDLETGESELREAREWLAVSRREAREYERFFGGATADTPERVATIPVRMAAEEGFDAR